MVIPLAPSVPLDHSAAVFSDRLFSATWSLRLRMAISGRDMSGRSRRQPGY
jgi:hypothetical protein